jgi:hypothetical protein
MLFREKVAVYCENHREHTGLHKLHGRNVNGKADGARVNYCAVRAKKARRTGKCLAIRARVVRGDVMNVK